jgi:hypothetical protein
LPWVQVDTANKEVNKEPKAPKKIIVVEEDDDDEEEIVKEVIKRRVKKSSNPVIWFFKYKLMKSFELNV